MWRRRRTRAEWERCLSLFALLRASASDDEREAAQAAIREECDPREGVGAFGWAILSALLVIGFAVGAWSANALH